jgi:glycosyltransferase involved in cell wall biosynthesis
VLEAMARRVPVVCSAGGSLAEVAGDAALLVEPDDVPGLTAALTRVLAEPALAEDLRERGAARAAGFSWERTARLTAASYERALAGSPAA